METFYAYGVEVRDGGETFWAGCKNLRAALRIRETIKRPTGRIAIVASGGGRMAFWSPIAEGGRLS